MHAASKHARTVVACTTVAPPWLVVLTGRCGVDFALAPHQRLATLRAERGFREGMLTYREAFDFGGTVDVKSLCHGDSTLLAVAGEIPVPRTASALGRGDPAVTVTAAELQTALARIGGDALCTWHATTRPAGTHTRSP